MVAGNLEASQRLLGDRLRTLYEEGEPDAIAVLLGATSLDERRHPAGRARAERPPGRPGGDRRPRRPDEAAGPRPRARGARPARSRRSRHRAVQTAAALRARAGRPRRLSRVARAAAAPHATADPRTRLTRPSGRREGAGRCKAQSSPDSSTAPAQLRRSLTGARTLTVTVDRVLAARAGPRPGFRSGSGIVAVDPAVIPLGTRLSIPGLRRRGRGRHGWRGAGHDDRPVVPDPGRSPAPGAGARSRSRSTKLRPPAAGEERPV